MSVCKVMFLSTQLISDIKYTPSDLKFSMKIRNIALTCPKTLQQSNKNKILRQLTKILITNLFYYSLQIYFYSKLLLDSLMSLQFS